MKKPKRAYLKFFSLLFALPLLGTGCASLKNDGGIYKTTDSGQSWKQMTTIENSKETLAKADTNQIIADPFNPDTVFFVTSSNGLFASNHFGENWRNILPETSDVFRVEANPFKKDHFCASILLKDRGKIVCTSNGGTDWQEIYTEAGKGSHITHLKFDPFKKDLLFAVNSEGVLIRTLDNGETWQPIFNFKETVHNLVFDYNEQNSIFALTGKGIWHSEDGGHSFSLIPIDENREMGESFNFLEKSEGRLFLASEKGFFVSLDNGRVWRKIITLNNPNEFPVNTVAIFPDTNGKQWAVGAGMTLYLTKNEGLSWKAIQFSIDRQINSILIKKGDPQQILVGTKVIKQPRIGIGKVL